MASQSLWAMPLASDSRLERSDRVWWLLQSSLAWCGVGYTSGKRADCCEVVGGYLIISQQQGEDGKGAVLRAAAGLSSFGNPFDPTQDWLVLGQWCWPYWVFVLKRDDDVARSEADRAWKDEVECSR
ncbi:hypothetical protein E2P81_ATG11838 [Venturia nashicola]|nr:hypothetical protein E2P81_ATG11838 [Venturia nashicola]